MMLTCAAQFFHDMAQRSVLYASACSIGSACSIDVALFLNGVAHQVAATAHCRLVTWWQDFDQEGSVRTRLTHTRGILFSRV